MSEGPELICNMATGGEGKTRPKPGDEPAPEPTDRSTQSPKKKK